MYFLVIEGIGLRKLNISPFAGSIVHEVCKGKIERKLFIERTAENALG